MGLLVNTLSSALMGCCAKASTILALAIDVLCINKARKLRNFKV